MGVIEAHELRRTYRTSTGTFRRKSLDVEAVRGVTFAVEPGELFGLLGPNGVDGTLRIRWRSADRIEQCLAAAMALGAVHSGVIAVEGEVLKVPSLG